MKVTIDGNLNPYYVQTLCMLFFPGSKFSDNEPVTDETPVVAVAGEACSEGYRTTVHIELDGCSSSHTHVEPYSEERTQEKTARISLGVAFFRAGEKMFGYTPAWGILTGVRPSKIAAALMEEGKNREAVIRELTEEYLINPKKAALATDVVFTEKRLIDTLPDKSCSVYISIPFCPSRCAYCSFVSYSTKRLISMIPDYLKRLEYDIPKIFDTIRQTGHTVSTVYIGGGTPTILTADQLRELLACINRYLDRTNLLEFTVEAGRPDTVTSEKLRVLNEGGVTRISINPQTMNDKVLEAIGRHHTSQDFLRAFDIARQSGIHCINADLIAGLPSERFASFSRSVDAVLALRPENVTFHTFCVKKSADILKSQTEIYSRTGGDAAKSVEYAQFRARMTGYEPYYLYRQKNSVGNFENVGFSKPGYEGLYNIFIMEEIHPIFAAGAGGVTKIMTGSRENIRRLFMPKYPYEYLGRDAEQSMREYREKILRFYESGGTEF